MAKIKQVKMENEKGGKKDVSGLLIGVLMVLAGLYVWMNPATALAAISLYIGIVFILMGAGYVMANRMFKTNLQIVLGVLNIVIGILFITSTKTAVIVIPTLFALWALSAGIVKMVGALQLRKIGLPLWSIPFASGMIGLVFGLLVLLWPAVGAVTITVLMGSYFVLYGALDIASYFLVKKA